VQLPSLVIFDCDGVLVDSEHLSHQVLHELLLKEGVPISYEQTLLRFMGTSTEGFLAAVSSLCGRIPETFLENFRDGSLAAFEERLTVVPGIEDVLQSLPMPYCVASNGRHFKMQATLGKTGLLRQFENRIFSAEDVARPKPAPDLFLHAAKALGAKPSECVVVEDSPTGVLAARSAGMRVFGYAAMTPQSRLLEAGAHAIFSSMSELPSLLGTEA
jgi:HAD superfamily hydrolase (TIGR01509 family)